MCLSVLTLKCEYKKELLISGSVIYTSTLHLLCNNYVVYFGKVCVHVCYFSKMLVKQQWLQAKMDDSTIW
jgi:hypothetical protein